MTPISGGFRDRGRCRGCGHAPVTPFLDLGYQPQSTRFPWPTDPRPDPAWPLLIEVCSQCWLVQLDGHAPGEGKDDPPIVGLANLSASMEAHARASVDALAVTFRLTPHARVVEFASHGNHRSRYFAGHGITPVIVEHNRERAEQAIRRGEQAHYLPPRPTSASTVRRIGLADLLLDDYELAHLRDPGAGVATIVQLLAPEGTACLEFDSLLSIIEGNQFDAMRHGHFSYFSLTSLAAILDRHDLVPVQVVELSVYGGALRVLVRHRAAAGRPDGSVRRWLAREDAAGLRSQATYAAFAQRVARLCEALRTRIEAAHSTGRSVGAYGAPSRAATLLNACGLSDRLIPFTVDRSPAKHGRCIPGVRVPILALESVMERRPSLMLLLTWDLASEVTEQMASIGQWGGRFLIPIPDLMERDPARPQRPRAVGAD